MIALMAAVCVDKLCVSLLVLKLDYGVVNYSEMSLWYWSSPATAEL